MSNVNLKKIINTSLGYANASLGYANASLGYANTSLGYANASLGYANASLSYANTSLGYANADLEKLIYASPYTNSMNGCNTPLDEGAIHRVSTDGLFVAFFFKIGIKCLNILV
ncbi:hypothetical protein WKK05_06550 [Nostoc sp. UHCC 0302]|uniref:hypothetical protein n=1 Tax=Nostoc sp. UHCC 0302 TaxID=3134896 RepID=UPI00311CBB8D